MSVYHMVIYNLFFYSFCGWIIEELYSLYSVKYLRKDNFLIGPIKPMYGICCTLLLYLYQNFRINSIFLFCLCFIVPTSIEYITGIVFKIYFHKKYWDYSNLKDNYKGVICLRFSIYWTVLLYILINFIHNYIKDIYYYFDDYFYLILITAFLLFCTDFILSLIKIERYRKNFVNIFRTNQLYYKKVE